MSYGAPGCLSLAGTVLDDLVAEQVMQVLEPASVELSLAAEQALRAEREQLEGHWQQRLERARYEVELVDLKKFYTEEQIRKAKESQRDYAKFMADRGI